MGIQNARSVSSSKPARPPVDRSKQLARATPFEVHIYPHTSVGHELSVLGDQMSYAPVTIHEPSRVLGLKYFAAHPCVGKKERVPISCLCRGKMPPLLSPAPVRWILMAYKQRQMLCFFFEPESSSELSFVLTGNPWVVSLGL